MTPRHRTIARTAELLLTTVLGFTAASSSSAQDGSRPVLRYGNTSPVFSYDGRSDDRDFRNNAVFPGNFAGDPPSASIGIEGFLAGNSRRSPQPYPSQVVMTPPVPSCANRHHRRTCK